MDNYLLCKTDSTFDYQFVRGKRVLILDDNQLNVELLEATLEPFELELHCFLKPQDAISSIKENKYDLFLLDIMIPEISGFDVADVIQQSPQNQNAPIIFISALSDSENKIKGYNLGSVAYIEKPFDINVVQSQIYNILKTKSLQDALDDNKETFLAMVTHDLKTPINAGICALELLLKKRPFEPDNFEHELILDMLSSSKYMKNLVENLLIKYKSENDEIVLRLEPHSLESIIQKCLDEVHYITQGKEQKFTFKNKTKNSVCNLDYVEIKRTINNLLSNANQYSTPKSTIIIELKETESEFLVEIINKSNSENSKSLKHDIFEKFVQQSKSSKTITTGLGLYICKRIVELHNGKISYEPLSNNRHKFSFTVPKLTRLK